MNIEELALRRGIINSCKAMNASGINQGTSGNISARYGDSLLITPSGVPYEELAPEDIVGHAHPGRIRLLDGTDAALLGMALPSRHHPRPAGSRRRGPCPQHLLHDAGDLRPRDPGAALHDRGSRRAHHPLAPYATYGTKELSENALKALEGRNCCLLANHGMIATGPNLKRAMWLAMELETLARQYYLSLAIGGPKILPDSEIAHVMERFREYGPRGKTALAPAPSAAARSKPPAKDRQARK